MVKRSLIAFAFIFELFSTPVSSQPGASYAFAQGGIANNASIMANVSGSGFTIPSNFVGLSFETLDLVTGGFLQGNTGQALSLINLLKLWGNGNIRIGGNTSDAATPPALTSGIVNNLNAFMTGLGAGWLPLIYGLDLFANNSATAASQASLLATSFGTANVVFQFGNEPISGGNFSTGTYITAWNAYYTAVVGAVPGVKVASIDDALPQDVQSVVPSLTPGVAGMSFISYHWYYYPPPNPTFAQLLTDYRLAAGAVGGYNGGLLKNTSFLGAVPQRMSESNTVAQGGVNGTSNVLVAAAWYLNEAIGLAGNGWQGINTHLVLNTAQVGHLGYYNPIAQAADTNWIPTPMFYGMYMFSKLTGQQIMPSAVGGNANVNAIATLRAAGKANILVVNNDVNQRVSVTPQQSAAWSTANVLQVASPSGRGCAESAPTVGGQAIGESGAWSGSTYSISSGQAISLGPCEAALVSVQ